MMDAAEKVFGAEAIMVAVTGCLLEALEGDGPRDGWGLNCPTCFRTEEFTLMFGRLKVLTKSILGFIEVLAGGCG